MNLKNYIAEISRKIILDTYTAQLQNQSHTAKELGISRTALIYKLKEYGILTAKPTTEQSS